MFHIFLSNLKSHHLDNTTLIRYHAHYAIQTYFFLHRYVFCQDYPGIDADSEETSRRS